MSEDALTSTFTRFRGKVLRIALRFFSDEDDANDALQDAFCRLWPKRGEIATREEAEAMATVTVRNLGIDAWRKRHTAEFVGIDERRDAALEAAVSDRLEAREQFYAVEAIIDRYLTETQKTVLRMKEYDGESYEAIAARLGMEQAAVRMQLSRARKVIRDCYRKLNGDDHNGQ